eukprot:GDKJ01019748.1.p1 GENE.GDKJ01019748.1~~GDKJ01019748.1.p1  ORF type:complete len:165 (-),score=50.58 GDKJ01019748.1:77-571(-)
MRKTKKMMKMMKRKNNMTDMKRKMNVMMNMCQSKCDDEEIEGCSLLFPSTSRKLPKMHHQPSKQGKTKCCRPYFKADAMMKNRRVCDPSVSNPVSSSQGCNNSKSMMSMMMQTMGKKDEACLVSNSSSPQIQVASGSLSGDDKSWKDLNASKTIDNGKLFFKFE